MDDQALLACAAYVNLNPIRAGLADTLEDSDHTSVQRRIQSVEHAGARQVDSPAAFLAPLRLNEVSQLLPHTALPHRAGRRCSDLDFLSLSVAKYVQLLDCTARHIRPGERGSTPGDLPPIFERLNLQPHAWFALVSIARQLAV